jgi:hypothetical protein
VSRHDIAHAAASLREALSGAAIRAAAAVRDVGEIILAKVQADDGGDHLDTGDDIDVWVSAKDALTDHPLVARLFIPLNLLWATPDADESAMYLRAGDSGGPGAGYLLYGDAGSAIPDWIREKVGLWHRKPLRVESTEEDVEVLAPADDKKVFVGAASDGSHQPAVLGTDLQDYLDDLRQKVNQLKDAVDTLKTAFNQHTQTLTGSAGPYPLSGTAIIPTPSNPSLPGNANAPDVLSDKVQIGE